MNSSHDSVELRDRNNDTESIRVFANRPTGNDEIEQSITENVDSDKIAETLYLIAEKRNFAPGNARSDWLKAESKVEDVLDHDFIDRRNAAIADRRDAASMDRRDSVCKLTSFYIILNSIVTSSAPWSSFSLSCRLSACAEARA